MAQNENSNTQDRGLLQFDPIVLVQDIAKRWRLILLAVLLAGMGAYSYATISYEPQYSTTFTYVTYTRSSTASIYSNLSSATAVASVFEELLNSSLLQDKIRNESDLESFDGAISAKVIPETNLLNVTVTGKNPRSVFLMAQAIVEHHEEVTYQVVDNVSLELLRSPVVPMSANNVSGAMSLAKKAVLVAAVAVVAMLGYLSFRRDTVCSSREAKSKLDCSCIGEVPHERKYRNFSAFLKRKEHDILVTNPLSSFRFVETFRKLASRVEYHMHGKKVVMVTSLLEDEGKSTVAVNLAMAMALKHEKVLLIDCDLRKPACFTLVDKKVEYGLCQVLEGKVPLDEALLQDRKSGLYMLLESNGTQESDEYISSRNMKQLLDWARGQFDFVVLDLPPMGPVSDAETMMDLADGSLLVVRQNTAQTAGINKAIASLHGGRAKLLGCVLNNAYSSGMSNGYGYGYGYGYGRYGSYGRYGKYGKYGHYGHYGHYSQYSAPRKDE